MSVPDWLATPELMPVWRSLRRPLEHGHRTSRVGVGLPRESRHALSGVLGAPLPASGSVVLAELSADLQARAGLGLRELVERLSGPLRRPHSTRHNRSIGAIDIRPIEFGRSLGQTARFATQSRGRLIHLV